MEAMAMELPVVGTRIAGIPELVDDGEQGLMGAPAASTTPRTRSTGSYGRQRSVGGWDEQGREKVRASYDDARSAERMKAALEAELDVPT
jgi:glycosyltransferase involved in cell wall biosynthesis